MLGLNAAHSIDIVERVKNDIQSDRYGTVYKTGSQKVRKHNEGDG